MKFCTKCVFPSVAATPLTFDEDGVCSGCRAGNTKLETDWEERKELLRNCVMNTKLILIMIVFFL